MHNCLVCFVCMKMSHINFRLKCLRLSIFRLYNVHVSRSSLVYINSIFHNTTFEMFAKKVISSLKRSIRKFRLWLSQRNAIKRSCQISILWLSLFLWLVIQYKFNVSTKVMYNIYWMHLSPILAAIFFVNTTVKEKGP